MLRKLCSICFYKNKTKIDTSTVGKFRSKLNYAAEFCFIKTKQKLLMPVLWVSLAVNSIMLQKLCSIFFIKTKQKLEIPVLWASLAVN